VLDDEERPVMSEPDAGSCAADAGTRVALGRMLAGLRQDAGLSQRQLARLIGFSHTAVAHSEKGRRAVAEAFWTLTDTALGADGHWQHFMTGSGPGNWRHTKTNAGKGRLPEKNTQPCVCSPARPNPRAARWLPARRRRPSARTAAGNSNWSPG
jgi:hypothetical protein